MGGKGEDRGECLSWAFCLIAIVFKFESLLYLQLWLRCYDSSNTAIPFTGKGQHFTYSFVQLEFHPFLTPSSIATYAQIHFAWPLACCLFFFFFWEKLLKSSLDASTWAGRGSSVELVLHTLLKSSPFLPWNLNRAARPALSHTCSWLHGHNTTAQERARRSRFLERGARLPVCLSVKCANSHWSPELQQKANLLAPAIS